MAETTIPKKHYVTIQYRKDASTESGLLGFASPYTKDAAFEKRKRTQDSWAYGSSVKVDINEDDDVSVSGTVSEQYGRNTMDASTLFITKCYPIIIDNVPVEGFEIAKSVRRSGWGGGGNVVWRLADPRGFELEISSDNFARVLDCTTIVNGVIQGKCLWGRNGSTNILLPEASDVYQEAKVLTEKVNKNVSLKDVAPGDIVEVLNKGVDKEDAVCEYLGKYFFVTSEQGQDQTGRNSYYNSNGKFTLAGKQIERYLCKSQASGKYFVLSSPKVIDIVTKLETPRDKAAIAHEFNDWISRTNDIGEIYHLLLASPTKVKLEDVTASLEPLAETITDQWPEVDSYAIDAIVCKKDDKFYISGKKDGAGGRYDSLHIPTLVDVNVGDIAKGKIDIGYTQVSNPNYRPGSYYSGYGHQYIRTRAETANFKFEEVEMFRMVVKTANGFTGKVYRIGYY